MATYKYKIAGAIPEKQFTLLRKNGKIEQCQESIDWEQKIKTNFADAPGWVSYTDTSCGAYTPLQVKLNIHTPKKTILIKQIKATLDAFSGLIYINDCSIVDLIAERIPDEEEYAELIIRPAKKENIELPDGDCTVLDRYIGPIKNSTFDVAGYPLQTEEYKKDKDLRDYIRGEFAAQNFTDEEIELTLHFSTVDIGVEVELGEQLEKLNMDKFPVRRPDVDNCAYSVLAALQGVLFRSPENIKKLHILKTYYNPEMGRNRIWIN